VTLQCWLASSDQRIYPRTPAAATTTLALDLLRGERGSFQVAGRTGDCAAGWRVECEPPAGLDVRLRRVGYVPFPRWNTATPDDDREGFDHIPGLVPDPLFDETQVAAGAHETNAVWVSVWARPDATPGTVTLPLRVTVERIEGQPEDAPAQTIDLTATVTFRAASLPARRDFPITNWFYADAIADWYGVDPWSEEFWRLARPYLRDITAHGVNVTYIPLFTPPLDGVKRPTQLVGVARDGDTYQFDWSLVERWLQEAREAGFDTFEWSHIFSQWGAVYAIRVYEGHGETETLLWDPETPAMGETYRAFLGQFLPEFERFLRSHNLMDRSLFHLSDEPHGMEQLENYRAARQLLRELAPWYTVMDALSEVEFAREGVTDMAVPKTSSVPDFLSEGFDVWAYYCCWPRGPYINRLFDTPLSKIRMTGFTLYKTGVRGFLHWAVNYWYESQTRTLIDPFKEADGRRWPNWPYGDPFVVYPGADGPLDSLRWEALAESYQDYAMLQAAGVDRNDPLLAPIIDFGDFPRDPAWQHETRRALRDRIERD
jgi:hypothetical protein